VSRKLGNPAVGRALAQVGVAVLDVAGLSAPSVSRPACGRACRRSGCPEKFHRRVDRGPKAASLRELYGALAPIAVVPAAGGDVVVCPGRDAGVAAGDDVMVIGTPGGTAQGRRERARRRERASRRTGKSARRR